MNIPQAARELAKAIEVADTGSNDEWPKDYFWKVEELITAALKRCRNEALEAAVIFLRDHKVVLQGDGFKVVDDPLTEENDLSPIQMAMILAIRNLKEAE